MKPLILLTRPKGKNAGLSTRLSEQGLATIALPVLELKPIDSVVVPNPSDYDLLVFVSGFAVDCYIQSLQRLGLSQWPGATQAAAVGRATAQAVINTGVVPVDLVLSPSMDSRQDSEALWAELQAQGVHPEHVLIVSGDSGRTWLAEKFAQAGAKVQRHCAYVRTAAQWSDHQLTALRKLLIPSQKLLVLLTSRQGVDAWLSNMQEASMIALVQNACFVVVHERIAMYVRQCVARLYPDAKPTIIVSKPDEKSLFQSIMTIAQA